MAVIIKLFFCVALVFLSAVQAQEKPPALPDPVALEASWWSYFEPTEEIEQQELDSRIEKVSKHLQQSLQDVRSEQQTRLAPLVKKISDGLKQFSALRQTADSDITALSVQAEQYNIEQALERFISWRKLKREINLEEEDLSWQNAQLSLERKRQSQHRSEYLQLDATDPQRLAKGLALMASRVSLELTAQQGKKRSIKLKESKLRLQRMEEELDVIHERLTPSTNNANDWQKLALEASNKADHIRQQANARQDELQPDTPLGSTNIKLQLLLSIAQETQATTHQLMAMRYRMIEALNNALSPDNSNVHDILNSISKEFLTLKQNILEQKSAWRAVTDQSRKFAAAQSVNAETTDKALVAAYQRLIMQADQNERWLRDLDLELDTSDFITKLMQSTLNSDSGWLNSWLTSSGTWLENSWGNIGGWLNATLFEINETPVTSAGLLRVVIIISVALLISKLLRRGLERLGQHKQSVSASALYTLGRVIHYIILITGIVVALSSIGIDFTKFALFASALGVGIGFGLQTLISNFVSGLIILFERSLKVGDFVELSTGLVGEVKEINMRSTLVTTNDNVDILVPNSEFMNNQVTNWTLRDAQRRIHVPFGVAYGTDKDLVRKAALEAADEVEWTLNTHKGRHPQVWFVQFGDSSLNFELVVWLRPEAVKRPGFVQASYLWQIDTKLRKYGIEVPFPQRDLHLRSVFGEKEEAGLALLNKRQE